MAKKESSLLNMTLTLFVITAVAAVALGFVYKFTLDPIAKAKEKKLNEALAAVLPKFDKIVPLEDGNGVVAYEAYTNDGEYLGVAVESATNGFGGEMKLLIGFNKEDKIYGYSVLNHVETPGLGSKMGEWFQKDGKGNIIGKDFSTNEMKVKKDGGDVDAITAATISSRAFCVAVNNAYKSLQSIKGDSNNGITENNNETKEDANNE